MEQVKVCPFMSTSEKQVACLQDRCQIWFREDQDRESSLNPANCSLAYLPQVVLEIAAHTRLIRGSMEESIAI
jgi:acyl-CoA thioesterase